MYDNQTPAYTAWSQLNKAMKPQISYSMIKKEAFKKLGVKSMPEFLTAISNDGVNTDTYSKRLLLQAAALDDWDSVWSYVKPHALSLGKGALKMLLTRALGALGSGVGSLIGGDEGINSIDWPGSSNLATSPYKIALIPGTNVDTAGIKHQFPDSSTGSESVSTKAIATVISPETVKYRYSYIESTKTALAVVRSEYNVTSGVNGQFGVTFSTMTCTNTFGLIYDSGFDVTTGIAVGSTVMTSPLSSISTVIDVIRVSAASLQFTPIASLNTAGALTMAYNPRLPSAAPSSTNMAATLSSVQTWPYVTSFNVRTPMRMVATAADSSSDDFVAFNGTTNAGRMVIFASGLPASTSVGRLIVTQNVEFIPSNTYFPVCPVDWPICGPATEAFETYMFTKFPVIQSLDLQDASRIAAAIAKYDTMDFKELTQYLMSLIEGIAPRLYEPHNAPPPVFRPNYARDPEYIGIPNVVAERDAARDALPYYRAQG